MKRRFLSPWQCDSDRDYYAQFEQPESEYEPEDEDYDDEGAANLEVTWEVQQ